jgi:hypothetical protein
MVVFLDALGGLFATFAGLVTVIYTGRIWLGTATAMLLIGAIVYFGL